MRWRKESPRSRCWSDSVRRRGPRCCGSFFGTAFVCGTVGAAGFGTWSYDRKRETVRSDTAWGPQHFPPSVFGYRSPSGVCGMPAPRSGFRKRGRPTSLSLPERRRARSVRSRREGRWPSFVSAVLSPFCFGSWEHEPKTRRCRNRSRFRRRWHRSRNRRKTMPEESERRGLVCSGAGLGSVPRFRMRRPDRVLREREIGKEDRARR